MRKNNGKLNRFNSYTCDIMELRFNHYNINKKQIEWMKGFFKKDSFLNKKDNSMNIFNHSVICLSIKE